jgi:hypothetical protein
MAKYQVTSHRLAGAAFGTVVSDSDLDGANIDALVEGGHLTPVSKTSKKDEAKAEDN